MTLLAVTLLMVTLLCVTLFEVTVLCVTLLFVALFCAELVNPDPRNPWIPTIKGDEAAKFGKSKVGQVSSLSRPKLTAYFIS